jgi:hypothetical protein
LQQILADAIAGKDGQVLGVSRHDGMQEVLKNTLPADAEIVRDERDSDIELAGCTFIGTCPLDKLVEAQVGMFIELAPDLPRAKSGEPRIELNTAADVFKYGVRVKIYTSLPTLHRF